MARGRCCGCLGSAYCLSSLGGPSFFLTGHSDICGHFGHCPRFVRRVLGADVPDKRTGHFSLLENVRFVRVRPDLNTAIPLGREAWQWGGITRLSNHPLSAFRRAPVWKSHRTGRPSAVSGLGHHPVSRGHPGRYRSASISAALVSWSTHVGRNRRSFM